MDPNATQSTTKQSLKTTPKAPRPSTSPSDARVVSQSQDSERLFDTPDSAPDHQHILDALCPADNVDNTPRVDTPRAPLVPTPIIASPDRASAQVVVAARLFTSDPAAKNLKSLGRKNGVSKKRKKRPYACPTTSLLWFLREDFVDANAKQLGAKYLSTTQMYKPVRAFWSKATNKSRKKNLYAPFQDMQDSISKGRPLSMLYRRLLLEDFMLLEKNDEVVCYMAKGHPLFKSSTWVRHIKESLQSNPYEPMIFKGILYFGFAMKVFRNIYRSDILNGIFSKSELKNNCTKRGGHGLTMELVENGYKQLITFDHILHGDNLLIVYGKDLPPRDASIRTVLKHVTDATRTGPTASRLIHEVFGDKAMSLTVLHYHDSMLKNNLRAKEDLIMRDTGISTNRIIQTFTLENNNAAFVKVRDEVDRVISHSVFDIYGNFSELTSPILSEVCSNRYLI